LSTFPRAWKTGIIFDPATVEAHVHSEVANRLVVRNGRSCRPLRTGLVRESGAVLAIKGIGSFATSAPVQAQLEFPEYFQVVQTSVGSKCAGVIKSATDAVTSKMSSNQGMQELVSKFNLCAASASPLDQGTFMGAL
jgi:hypothetical protein